MWGPHGANTVIGPDILICWQRHLWLQVQPSVDPFALLLVHAGITLEDIQRWHNGPNVPVAASDGQPATQPLFDVLAGMDTVQCKRTLLDIKALEAEQQDQVSTDMQHVWRGYHARKLSTIGGATELTDVSQNMCPAPLLNMVSKAATATISAHKLVHKRKLMKMASKFNTGKTGDARYGKTGDADVRLLVGHHFYVYRAPFFQNGAKSGFEMCFGPSTLGAGAKTRLESRIKKFTPHCVCRRRAHHVLPQFPNHGIV